MKVPFLNLPAQYKSIKKQTDKEIKSVVDSGMFVMGKDVSSFEEKMDSYLKTNSVACASGSDALLMALKAAGIQDGDEVITSPFTFFATAGAIVRAGGKPVFVDIQPDNYNIDPGLITAKITKNTKALMPVHIFGYPADMTEIMAIAKDKKLVVIEDACQAVGSTYKNKKLGSIGDFGAFSFFPTKNLGCYGDGGLVTAKSKKHYEFLKKFRDHGASKKYYHDFVGINSRLDALQAAILKVKLSQLDKWNKKRRQIAAKYTESLKDYVKTPVEKRDGYHVYHQYSIMTPKRDELLEFLNYNDISAGVYYPIPLHLQKCFKDLGYKRGDLPVSEQVSKQILSLPIFPEITEAQIKYVVKTIKSFYK